MTYPSDPQNPHWAVPNQQWGPAPQPGFPPAQPGWGGPVMPPGPAAPTGWMSGQAPAPRTPSNAGMVAVALTYLTGVLSAGFATVACIALVFTQALAREFDGLSSGFSTSSRGLGETGTNLALSTVLFLVVAALCFIGAVRLSTVGSSGWAYAGVITCLVLMLLGSIGSNGGGWLLLLVLAPLGALVALLVARQATTNPAR
ncbi:hypothetical protein FDO65_10590 [Nakamurella flava]|uniref:Uncharacterized protein n=1 Tax=Nakamurella flava TaxID=2576308 RepID=A0A4U6QMN3_9ACTN|nr:hypothetical protein [Nakamurella flava]TKV61947.1 hypothetical protein FDO65_10590 [Nakamurella flava]